MAKKYFKTKEEAMVWMMKNHLTGTIYNEGNYCFIVTDSSNMLLDIAKKYCHEIKQRGNLNSRMNDEDMIKTSVMAIEAMLIEAYELGRKLK